MRFNLLGQELTQHQRLSEILGPNDDTVGVRWRTRAQHQGKQKHTASIPVPFAGAATTALHEPFHRGRNRLSNHPRPKSADRARTAAGMAPAKMSWLFTIARPRKMNSPKPPAPIAASIVASPTETTTATRTPERITLTASGSST